MRISVTRSAGLRLRQFSRALSPSAKNSTSNPAFSRKYRCRSETTASRSAINIKGRSSAIYNKDNTIATFLIVCVAGVQTIVLSASRPSWRRGIIDAKIPTDECFQLGRDRRQRSSQMSVRGQLDLIQQRLIGHGVSWNVPASRINEQTDRLAELARIRDVVHDALQRHVIIIRARPDVCRRLESVHIRQWRFAAHLLAPHGIAVTKTELGKLQRQRRPLAPNRLAVVLGLP